ncbi:hypothetical protein [Xenorhabdus bovienii]|uniref:hypothetical protein n=1 Tax=Xenorhabdus bovienii TaxID=40576 RepID=UPI0023B2973F|nr:hypothetical protein [Xenorhabdus bovienii]MDE9544160.1 hypothetical protein [Xenorhabdus bovienii]
MKIKNDIMACPNCGNSEELFVPERLKGKIYPRYRFDGLEADNTQLWHYVRSDQLIVKTNYIKINSRAKEFGFSQPDGTRILLRVNAYERKH